MAPVGFRELLCGVGGDSWAAMSHSLLASELQMKLG